MLDRLFLSKLTKKGKIAYFLIQLVLDAIFVFVLFGLLAYDLGSYGSPERDESSIILIPGILIIAILTGILCLQIWRNTDEA